MSIYFYLTFIFIALSREWYIIPFNHVMRDLFIYFIVATYKLQLWVSDDPAYNLSFRVLKGSGAGAEHWVPIRCI